MRQGPSNRRARGRGSSSGRRGNLPNRNQTFDSNGPDVRIRGTAFQVNEKYQALARDASASGDRIMAENYLQHAEHYYRIIAAINDAQSQQQSEGRGDGHRQRDGHRGDGAHRENGHRDGGQRESGQRDGGVRENGHHTERVAAASKPTEAESEFGRDPRQDDARDGPGNQANGEAVIEVIAGDPAPALESEPVEEAPAGNGADAKAEDAPPPKPRRRGAGRSRKSAAAKESPAPASEANTDGD